MQRGLAALWPRAPRASRCMDCTHKRAASHARHRARLAMYGGGMAAGALLLRALRRKLQRIPLLGVIATPILGAHPGLGVLGALRRVAACAHTASRGPRMDWVGGAPEPLTLPRHTQAHAQTSDVFEKSIFFSLSGIRSSPDVKFSSKLDL